MPAMALLLPSLARAAASSISTSECTSDMDCALAGSCGADGRCRCDPGWKTPGDGGTPCSAFDLLPANPAMPGYRNHSWPSWGGHPVLWPDKTGGDGRWHLFTPQFANGCEVDSWIKNSFIVHAVGDSPIGPWRHHDVAVPVWSHGSQAAVAPDGTWLLFFVGGWHYPPDQWATCEPQNRTVPWPVEPDGPGLPAIGDCGPVSSGLNAGCGIRVASSASPFGPWKISDVKFKPDARPSAKALTCARSDPAPWVLADGSTYLAFGCGGCVGGLETIGVAKADRWNATFAFTSSTGGAIADTSEFKCPTGQLAEDPNLFRTRRGWHLIAHGLCSWHRPGLDNMTDLYGLHAFSIDGARWRVATDTKGMPVLPWSKNVTWSNGSNTYISRMERPQVITDGDGGKILYLTTAVCVGGESVGGRACTSPDGVSHKSWDLYRPVKS